MLLLTDLFQAVATVVSTDLSACFNSASSSGVCCPKKLSLAIFKNGNQNKI